MLPLALLLLPAQLTANGFDAVRLPFFASPKSMCYNVTTSQTAEVKAMYEYLAKNGYPTPDKFEGGTDCPTSKAYLKNQEKMMAGMTLDYTCDPTVDFMSGMLAHHTGAIGMCKVVTDAEASARGAGAGGTRSVVNLRQRRSPRCPTPTDPEPGTGGPGPIPAVPRQCRSLFNTIYCTCISRRCGVAPCDLID